MLIRVERPQPGNGDRSSGHPDPPAASTCRKASLNLARAAPGSVTMSTYCTDRR